MVCAPDVTAWMPAKLNLCGVISGGTYTGGTNHIDSGVFNRITEERRVLPVTVRNAVYGIQRKLGVGSKQEVVVWAVRNGLLDD